MNKGIERLKNSRAYFLNLIEGLTTEQLNEIPAGFNNNIIWNLGHLIVSQQSVCYLRAQLKPVIDNKYFPSFDPGTKPLAPISTAEIGELKTMFADTIDQLEIDFENDLFTNYQAYKTRSGFSNNTIEDGIAYVLFHDALHAGYVTALKRILMKTNTAK